MYIRAKSAQNRVTLGDRRPVGASVRVPAAMIACFTVKRRIKLHPEVVLWRGVVLALG
jgi:hypothetical protein